MLGANQEIFDLRSLRTSLIPLIIKGGDTPYGYTGLWYGSYTDLLFLRARWLMPETETFLSKDVWKGDYLRPLSLNGWSYVEGNSVNSIDPSGLCPDGRCDQWIDLIWQRFQIVTDRNFLPETEIPAMEALQAYQKRDLRCEENLWTEQELTTVYLFLEMLQEFLGPKFNQYIAGSSIRRVHFNALLHNDANAATTYPSDPRNLGLSGPIVELPTGSFHENSGNGNLKPQGDTLHTLFHESFHVYEFKFGYSILRDFGDAAGWSMLPDLGVQILVGCVGSTTCNAEKYRNILAGTSRQDSEQVLSEYGEKSMHEDFPETSAQFAEIWLSQNGYPLAEEAYKYRSTYYDSILQRERNLFDLASTLNWLENHYGRRLQKTSNN